MTQKLHWLKWMCFTACLECSSSLGKTNLWAVKVTCHCGLSCLATCVIGVVGGCLQSCGISQVLCALVLEIPLTLFFFAHKLNSISRLWQVCGSAMCFLQIVPCRKQMLCQRERRRGFGNGRGDREGKKKTSKRLSGKKLPLSPGMLVRAWES